MGRGSGRGSGGGSGRGRGPAAAGRNPPSRGHCPPVSPPSRGLLPISILSSPVPRVSGPQGLGPGFVGRRAARPPPSPPCRVVFLLGRERLRVVGGGGGPARGQRAGVCKRPALALTTHKRLPDSRDAKATEVNFRAISQKETSRGGLGPLEGHGQPRAETGLGPHYSSRCPPMGSPLFQRRVRLGSPST